MKNNVRLLNNQVPTQTRKNKCSALVVPVSQREGRSVIRTNTRLVLLQPPRAIIPALASHHALPVFMPSVCAAPLATPLIGVS